MVDDEERSARTLRLAHICKNGIDAALQEQNSGV